MYRFAIALLLTLALLVSCRASRSTPPVITPAPEQPTATLTVQKVKSAPFIWWEAEQPSETNFPPVDRNPFAPANATEAAVLSGGEWIGVDEKRQNPAFLEYQVIVPSADQYFFYSRKFWQHGPFRWQWDDQPWQQIRNKVALMDEAPLREFTVANWVGLGTVELTAGTHTLRIELTQTDGVAAFDCFVLTQTPLQARGKLKPDERYTANIPGWFLFDPEADPFRKSAIDLRSLNETVAGENGWIQVKGEDFIHEKTQQPVRFWAVNAGMGAIQMDQASMQYMARFLAKLGVNMVRLHGPLWSKDFRKIDPADLNQLFAFVAAMKNEGIYTCLSIYFPVWLNLNQDSEFPGYTGQHPFALLFFNQAFQKIYYNWWRAILTTKNPATGKPLVDDPALAMVELVNEDSFLFWTFQPYESIPEPQVALLEQQFGNWLTQKYGSLEQALTSWKPTYGDRVKGDDLTSGRVGFMPLYDITAKRNSIRAQDTATFLAESQQQFFQGAIAFLKRDLNYKGLIYASNWVTANAQILGPLDKYTNMVADFIDRHGYFNSPHKGEHADYSLAPGHTYEERSALLFTAPGKPQEHDFNLPLMDIRYNNLPSTITEINWAMPNRFRADFPLLTAAYGLLQGSDGFFFFATNRSSWDQTLSKFGIASPTIMGQFPATALIFRNGLLKPGADVVNVSLKTEDLKRLKGAPVVASQNLDELRAKDIPAGQAQGGGFFGVGRSANRIYRIDPLATLVGKVNLSFSNQVQASQQMDLSQFINRKAKTIQSSTKELLWNYDKGLITVESPQVQGVAGFLKQAGSLTFTTLTITSDIDYGTILLVALDDRPLTQSHSMLLQVMSEEQNFGWKVSGQSPRTIESLGQAPLVLRNLAGTVALQHPDAKSLTVTALDANGYPASTLGNATSFRLLPNTLYYLIEQQP